MKMTSGTGLTNRGFTIIEIMVALVLVGLFTGMAVVGVRSVTRARLKETANQMVGLIRDTYNRAALSNKVHRIVFDLGKNEFWVEVTNDNAHVKSDSDIDEGGRVEWNDEKSEDGAKKPPAFKSIDDEDLGKKQKLPGEVKFWRIWVGHQRDRVTKGKVELNFFPDGYTENAHITLTDDRDGAHTLTIVTAPLTGEATIENVEPEIENPHPPR